MPHHSGLHAYGTDSAERRLVPFLLAAAAIGGALLLSRMLMRLGWEVPWWVDAPSVMGLYGALHGVFDGYIWRWSWLRRVGLIKVPDLSGSWRVGITSSHEAKELDAQVQIHQSWRGMHVRFETGQSRSSSLIASLLTSDPNDFVLVYEFLNSPKQGAVDTMHAHRGSAEVRFPRVDSIIRGYGEYYSGRDRANQGTLTFTRS